MPRRPAPGRVRPDRRQQPLQLALADAELFQMPQRADQVVEVVAGEAATAADEPRLQGERQPASVARMRALDDVGKRQHLAPRPFDQRDGQMRLAIDPVDLLAGPQIADGLGRIPCRHAIGDTLARPAAVEAQHLPRPPCPAAVMHRVDAEAAPVAGEARVPRLLACKPRPPHQRPVAEHPEVVSCVGHRTVRGSPTDPPPLDGEGLGVG